MNAKVLSVLVSCVLLRATQITAFNLNGHHDTPLDQALTVTNSTWTDHDSKNESFSMTDTISLVQDDLNNDLEWEDNYDDDEYFEESTEGIFPKPLYTFFIYFILIFGIIGNGLIFALMQQGSLRDNSYSIFLSFLAVFDTLVLITVCIEDILEHHFDALEKTIFSSTISCRLWSGVRGMALLASPWFVVAFTGDRYVAVVFPFHRKTLSTRKIALTVSVVIAAVTALEALIFQTASEFSIVAGPEEVPCEGHSESIETYLAVQLLLLGSTLPCALILYFNLHIIIGIKRSSKFRRSASDQEREKARADRRITVSLVAVSLMAFCCLTPVALTEVMEAVWMRILDTKFQVLTNTTDMDEFYRLDNHILRINKAWPLLNLVKLFNFGQNFYVMMATCQKYRQAFLMMLCYPRLHQATKQREK